MKKGTLKFSIGEVDGLKFIILNPREIIQSFLNSGKYYEEGMVEFIKDNYKGGTFIDVGSCIGSHTLAFSKLADEVISFEPITMPGFHQMCNILINETKNITLYNIALGNKKGIVKMNIISPETAVGGGTIMKDGILSIPVLKLDDFGFEDVTLIKIDVEEYEDKVLKGGKKTILKNRPDLFVECSTEKMYKKVSKFLNSLNCGYRGFKKIIFNNTPTFLFTVKDVDSFKIRKGEEK